VGVGEGEFVFVFGGRARFASRGSRTATLAALELELALAGRSFPQGIQEISEAEYMQTVPSAPDPLLGGSAPVLLPV
jgi:hypothetical protein